MLEAGIGDRLSVIGDQTRDGEGATGVGVDFFLAFSPERIDPGRTDWTVENTPKVIGGVTPQCLEMALALYCQAVDRVVPVSSPAAAEMTKLLENTFRSVNIALVNEVAIMCDKLGIDVWEVIDAAATKPYGFMKFTPGPGVGGQCAASSSAGLHPAGPALPVVEAEDAELQRPLHPTGRRDQQRHAALLGGEGGRCPEPGRQAAQGQQRAGAGRGLSRQQHAGLRKKDIDDVRESPALGIIELLRAKGADVRYHDPYVAQFAHNGHGLRSEPDLTQTLVAADCVVVTDHSVYDWRQLAQMRVAVVDTRHVVS